MPALPDAAAWAAIAAAAILALLWLVAARGGRAAHAERERLAQREAALGAEAQGLADALAEVRAERDGARADLAAASAEAAGLRAAQTGLRAEAAALKGLREEMSDRFRALADDALRAHGESFAASNHERISALLAPVKEHVGLFQEELRAAHEGAARERERLRAEIEALARRSEQIGQDAVALTQALKGDKQRQGVWGEMILERLLEESGLTRGVHYVAQQEVRDEEGRAWRPDVVVKMPRGKCLVIDSKVSLVDYEGATRAEDEPARRVLARAHAAAVRRHVDELSARGYEALAEGSPDYVMMFMPIEGALAMALGAEGDLTAYALRRRVAIITPTTLMLALRTVEHVWAVERRESNAEAIANRAGKLYDKIALFVESMEKVGRALGTAREAHDEAMGRLSSGPGSAMRQAEMLRKLGARARKDMPAVADMGLPAVDAETKTGEGDEMPRLADAGAEAEGTEPMEQAPRAAE